MDPFANNTTSKKNQKQPQANPFANALAETEKPLSEHPAKNPAENTNSLFSEALARAGGALGDVPQNNQDSLAANSNQADNGMDQQTQMEEMRRQQEKKALQKKLHDQINPVDQHDVFNAREERVKEQIEQTRQEIQSLVFELEGLHKDIEIEASKVVNSPGDDGTYYINFFDKLRQLIMLLRQKVKSARSWANQMKAKSSKKKRKQGKKPGLEVSGQSHEQSKTVFDMMHHERSSSYGGS